MEARSSGASVPMSGRVVEPSIANALPHFVPLAIFPLVVCAALYGGWWIVGPFVFFMLAGQFDRAFGLEERNMDPATTRESQLFLYKLSLWLWAAFWPVTFVFSLWQMLAAGHLSLWEVGLMAAVLTTVAQTVFIVGHELVHRRALWERRLGEFLLASVSYPHYATEHVYIHHPRVCTPLDPGSAPKGMSFWQYLPAEVANNLVGAWRFERRRLMRRHLPLWHHTNAFWRYAVEIAVWYGLIYWMGGPLAVLIYVALCGSVVFSMKISNYVQHYALRRIRMPTGRFEPVKPRHAWSAAYKFTNWLYYNMQRHADHHTSNRRYPLLQHHGEAASPQLPGSYMQMNGLALFPKPWFETIDPLVDRQRAQFYPQIDDWSAYDSRAFAARPDAFDVIAEIHAAAPRLAGWINRWPRLLDTLREREFTDLELPEGFLSDPESESIARSGLARLYWTHELSVSEMKDQLADIPVQDAAEAVEAALEWSNAKVFQIAVHTMRGSLSMSEAGMALSRVTEASIATVLSAVEEDFADRGVPHASGGVAVAVLGPLVGGQAMPGTELDVRLVYDGGPARYYEALCRRFRKALRALSRNNLLLAPVPRGGIGELSALDAFRERLRNSGSSDELVALARARCVFVSGDGEIADRFTTALRDALGGSTAREALTAELREAAASEVELDLLSVADMPAGLRDLERAALALQWAPGSDASDTLNGDPASIFRAAGSRGLIAEDAAERLAEAATLWRNLHGSLRLIADDGFTVDAATSTAKTAIADACGVDDFGALAATIRDTACRVAADIDALAQEPRRAHGPAR
ncbi:fatty acid desaturase [Candidatus Palauibacter sp.]|uniref:fatty acid desaturase n=1 Tax=Candidatus Palauibacter sp. TaxID=3101350 RepID=UPI003B5202FD